jgi:hypothetical protein
MFLVIGYICFHPVRTIREVDVCALLVSPELDTSLKCNAGGANSPPRITAR